MSAEEEKPEEQPKDEEIEVLRQDLASFFTGPLTKNSESGKKRRQRRFPLKLLLQLLKLILVTAQVFQLGNYRQETSVVLELNQDAFKRLFMDKCGERLTILEDDTVDDDDDDEDKEEVLVLYRKTDFYWFFDCMAAHTFDNNNNDNSNNNNNNTLDFCVNKFWEEEEDCITISRPGLANITSKEYLLGRHFEVPWANMSSMKFTFGVEYDLGTVKRNMCNDTTLPKAEIRLDNSESTGMITVEVEVVSKICKVETMVLETVRFDLASAVLCGLSLLISLMALMEGQILRYRTQKVFRTKLEWKQLTWSENAKFVNLWYVTQASSDALVIAASIITFSTDDFRSVLLGTGCLLVWMGSLEYLAFFQTYNLLILTLKSAVPNVLRFLLCGAIIYFGFVFCGWIVLGPYDFKFKTISITSETLFSLINGDDMFPTFVSVPKNSGTVILVFSKVYLYTFICLYIYAVVTVFIKIIKDAHREVKIGYEEGFPMGRLQQFYINGVKRW